MNTKHSVSTLGTKVKQLRSNALDNWELTNFLLFYLNELKPLIKGNKIKKFELLDVDNRPNKYYKSYNNPDTSLGVISRIESKSILKNTLVEQISITEDFLQKTIAIVYKDYPKRIQSGNENSEDIKGYNKLLMVILNSNNREEIIDQIIEEKIRGIFYGNPIDFFKKDKAKLDFGNYFEENFSKTLNLYSEILARRNLYAHNNGIVDRKYLREVKSSPLKRGQKAIVDIEYITMVTKICIGLSVLTTKLVIENIYKEEFKSKIGKKIIRELKNEFE